MAVPVTPRDDPKFSSLGIVSAAVLGLTDADYNTTKALQFIPNMDGFPNGRRLEDDVTTIELRLYPAWRLPLLGSGDDYAGGSASPVTPQLVKVLSFNAGVTKNDTTFQACFPYVQEPWRGFYRRAIYWSISPDPLPLNFLDFAASKSGNKVQYAGK
jgi:hypothetical protein